MEAIYERAKQELEIAIEEYRVKAAAQVETILAWTKAYGERVAQLAGDDKYFLQTNVHDAVIKADLIEECKAEQLAVVERDAAAMKVDGLRHILANRVSSEIWGSELANHTEALKEIIKGEIEITRSEVRALRQ
jgi:hypothetical protein